jgi:plasmid stabilization system protein ParE
MNVRKSDEFISDVERQFEWYTVNADSEVADKYLYAVKATCQLLGQQPHIGPPGGFVHPQLQELRFFVVFRPFNRHVLFYEVVGEDVVLRRVMHGHRNLLSGLLEPPGLNEPSSPV